MNSSLVNFDETELADDSSIAHYRRGETLANAGQYAEALASFDRSVALQPNYDAAWVFRGVVLIHLEQYSEALLSCDRAIEFCPTNSEAWLFRGVALQRLGQYQEAYASYDRAAGKEPGPFGQKLRQSLGQFRKGLISRNC